MTFDGRHPLAEDDLWRKTTLDRRHPFTEDDLWQKTTFDERRPLTEDDLWQKTTFDGRRHSSEDDLWQKTTFDRRRPLWTRIFERRQPKAEDGLWRKTTFCRRRLWHTLRTTFRCAAFFLYFSTLPDVIVLHQQLKKMVHDSLFYLTRSLCFSIDKTRSKLLGRWNVQQWWMILWH